MKRPLKIAGAALLVAAAGLLWWSVSANIELPGGPGVAQAAQPPAPADEPLPGVPPDGWITSRLVIDSPAAADGAGPRPTVSLGAAEESMKAKNVWYRGLLTREIARQALLIAARDGLGLGTRDATIGDPVPAGEGRVVGEFGSVIMPGAVASIRFRGGEGKEPDVILEGPAPPRGLDIVAWVERVEPLSRGAFVDALVKAGCPRGPIAGRSAAGVAAAVEADLATLSPAAQFAALRGLHDAIRREGESPELLGALVRGYAQLGVLTEYQWCAAHDAFKARALLYAQRLMAIDPASPSGPWHRAFAEALIGLHKAALDDLAEGDRRARAGKPSAKARPAWAGLIAAYCRHDPAGLVTQPGDRRAPLAALLGFLEIESSGATVQILEAGQAALRDDPECSRILDVLCAIGGVAVNNWAAQFGPAVLVQSVPARVRELPGLPAAVKDPLDRGEEAAAVQALVAAGAPGADRGEPSLAALGRMIREARYVVAWRQLRWMRDMLGIPTGEALEEVRPLVAGHPYRKY